MRRPGGRWRSAGPRRRPTARRPRGGAATRAKTSRSRQRSSTCSSSCGEGLVADRRDGVAMATQSSDTAVARALAGAAGYAASLRQMLGERCASRPRRAPRTRRRPAGCARGTGGRRARGPAVVSAHRRRAAVVRQAEALDEPARLERRDDLGRVGLRGPQPARAARAARARRRRVDEHHEHREARAPTGPRARGRRTGAGGRSPRRAAATRARGGPAGSPGTSVIARGIMAAAARTAAERAGRAGALRG